MLLRRIGDGRRGPKSNSLRRAAFDLAVLFLTALIVLAPLEPAYAQSTDASATTNADSATTGTSALGSDQTNVDTSTAQPSTTDNTPGQTGAAAPGSTPTPNTSPASPSATDSTSAPTTPSSDQSAAAATQSSNTTNPNDNSTQNANNAATPQVQTGPDLQPVVYNSFNQNQIKIDKNTGALNTTFPIDIPPGRNGLQPNVNLVYNSQNTQQGSIVGEGWSIGIPYIERLNINGVDKLYSTSTPSYFNSSLDGRLSTTTVGSSYIARTENGTFNKYTFSTNQWTVTDKNGTQYVFGSTPDSSQNDPNNASDTYRWMLKQVTDTNGNSITYNYFKDSGQIYPSSTIYTNTSSTTGIFEVDFLLASSTDNGTSSATGFTINSNYRVSQIDGESERHLGPQIRLELYDGR